MTRINLIHPSHLADQHLIAELKESRQLAGQLTRTLSSKAGFVLERVPKNYTFFGDHVYFFYNKGYFVERRYRDIVIEAVRRGNAIEKTEFCTDIWEKNPDLYGDWEPSQKDIGLSISRIVDRMLEKPDWYRYYKSPIAADYYGLLLTRYEEALQFYPETVEKLRAIYQHLSTPRVVNG